MKPDWKMRKQTDKIKVKKLSNKRQRNNHLFRETTKPLLKRTQKMPRKVLKRMANKLAMSLKVMRILKPTTRAQKPIPMNLKTRSKR